MSTDSVPPGPGQLSSTDGEAVLLRDRATAIWRMFTLNVSNKSRESLIDEVEMQLAKAYNEGWYSCAIVMKWLKGSVGGE